MPKRPAGHSRVSENYCPINNTDSVSRKKFIFHCRLNQLVLGDRTKIMGVVNITPDSFSQDGCMTANGDFTTRALLMADNHITAGADMIDIGGESSRPGSCRITVKEEIQRIIPAVSALSRRKNPIPLSVDTYKPLVARHALDAGAAVINNIMGTEPDRRLLKMVRNYDAGLVLMHMRGTPRTMQKNIYYDDLISEICSVFKNSLEICLEIGIKSDRIMLDPGIGFGKTVEHNLKIINHLNIFTELGFPLLIGPSRKSFIGKVLDKEVGQRLWGTAAAVSLSICRGAHMIRVHDVAAMKEVAFMTDAIIKEGTT